MPPPTKRLWLVIGAGIFLAGALLIFDAYRRSLDSEFQERNALLQQLPVDARAIFFAELQQLRQSQFATEFSSWIGNVAADSEYADFRQRTGFDFERDLQQIALAVIGDASSGDRLFALAHGNFDLNKLQAYAARSGKQQTHGEFRIASFDLADARKLSFTFLNRSTLALTTAPDLVPLLAARPSGSDSQEWNARFNRLAGSPMFAVIHQSISADKLSLPMPNGFQSPQLSALIDQLQWITMAATLQNSSLKVVAEGECQSEQTARQLADFLNGILVMAQAGLDTPHVRQQLAPASRDAYLELARTVEVSRLDRGQTKSVRVVFDITPGLLQAMRAAPPPLPASSQPPAREAPNMQAHKRSPRTKQK